MNAVVLTSCSVVIVLALLWWTASRPGTWARVQWSVLGPVFVCECMSLAAVVSAAGRAYLTNGPTAAR